ncbi:MAG: FecR domain-containing protein [Leptospiraceae bacterium]|nr:FecR domain-containing protein [Leptospiraceae bacterium]
MVLSRRDKIVTALLLLAVALLLYLLQCHWRRRSGLKGEAQPVGEVEYKYRQVQRKFADRMVWEDVEPKTPVYAYDWIMTQENSDARLSFKNGARVEIDPESLVEIEDPAEGTMLTLREGNIQADTRQSGKGVIRAADGSTIELEKGRAQVASRGKELSVDVKEGRAKIAQGNKKTIAESGEIVEKKGDEFQKTRTEIRLKSPPQEIVFDDPNRPVDFVFEAPPESRDCNIHLKSGDKTERIIKVAKGSTHREKLPHGTYYWRATCLAQNKLISSGTGTFRIRPSAGLELVAPRQGELVPTNQAETLVLRWQGGPATVELSQSPDFNPVITRAEKIENSYAVPKLKPGKYYWRVSLPEKNRSLKSHFVVSEQDGLLASAQLPEKAQGKEKSARLKQNADQEGEKKALLSVGAPEEIWLEPDAARATFAVEWKPNKKDTAYTVEVFADAQKKQPILKKSVRGKNRATLSLPPGTFFYAVSGKASDNWVWQSPLRQVTIRRKDLPGPPRVKSVEAQ